MKRSYPVKARVKLAKMALLESLGLRKQHFRDFTGTHVFRTTRGGYVQLDRNASSIKTRKPKSSINPQSLKNLRRRKPKA